MITDTGSISIALGSLYISVYLTTRIGNTTTPVYLERIRKKSINGIFEKNGEQCDINKFLNLVGERSPILFYPPQEKNKRLTTLFLLATMFMLMTISIQPASVHFQQPFLSEFEGYCFALFLSFLFLSSFYLYYDVKYTLEYKKLQLEFSEIDADENLLVIKKSSNNRKNIIDNFKIIERYIFATKAAYGEEINKSPTYIHDRGGYVIDKNFEKVNTENYKISLYAAHYAKDYGVGRIRISLYDDRTIVDEIIFHVTKQISDYRDVENKNNFEFFQKSLDFNVMKTISSVKVEVIPGNWAIVIYDFEIELA